MEKNKNEYVKVKLTLNLPKDHYLLLKRNAVKDKKSLSDYLEDMIIKRVTREVTITDYLNKIRR